MGDGAFPGITDRDWATLLEYLKKVSRSSRFKCIQFSILQRAYLILYKLAQTFPVASSECLNCQLVGDNLLHMLWSCPSLANYWVDASASLSALTGLSYWEVPAGCLLGLHPRPLGSKVELRFTDPALLLAKRQITRCWKSPQAPQPNQWHK